MSNSLLVAFWLVLALFIGVWTGVTAMALNVAIQCELDGKWAHESFILKHGAVSITCKKGGAV